ncbi:MAG: hypothetical protein ACOX7G_10130 [Candidatus Scatomorpha sp.]|jgi:hypothetical protein
MSFIPRVTCRRCGRQFSGMRGRCPYCGTRRVRQSERVPGPTPGEDMSTPSGQRAAVNARWQLIFGAILLVAVILAVVVLISLSLNSGGVTKTTPTLPAAPTDNLIPTATPSPTPSPTPTPTIDSVTLYFGSDPLGDDVTITSPLTISAYIWPMTVEVPAEAIIWETSDPNVATIEVNADDPKICTVTGVGAGSCDISVTVFGQTDKAIFRYAG